MIGESLWTPSLAESEPLVSYSQNAEDVRLWRVFRDVEDGFYVDIGAADPSIGSTTRLFYDHGWSGINVEPSPTFEAVQKVRERDVNLRMAVSESEGSTPFFLTYPDLGMSTLDPSAHAHVQGAVERVEEVTVPERRLESILREHAAGRTIHFLKVDVEGAEREVLASSDWSVYRPIVVLVEAVEAWSTTPTHEAWEPLLLDAGYHLATFDGINRFYVDRRHDDLIPALAYPMSALDRFVMAPVRDREIKADERVQQAEERVQHTEDERASVAARLDRALDELGEQLKESETLRQSFDHAREELAAARHELHLVYESPTWRTGRLIAVAGKPALAAARRVRRRRVPGGRKPRPAQAYAASVEKGQPWHFARETIRARTRRGGSLLNRLVDLFGEPNDAVDVARAAEIAEQIDQMGWCDEDSLLARRLSWDEREAVVEADAIVRLVGSIPDESPGVARHPTVVAKSVVVVDARCLQDPVYSTRGVGLHSRRVLHATRTVAAGHTLVLLTTTDLSALPNDVAELADHVVVTPYAVRAADVVLFVQLSPMTASCAATMPFLARPTCATASVVYDFIPTEFPRAYLRSTTSALENRTRIEALRHYDLLLAISGSTEAACRRILGERAVISVSGVGDPLDEVNPKPPVVDGPYMLVSAGGDPRKNGAAAVAALARHRQLGGGPFRAVMTGTLTPPQEAALTDLVSEVGLPRDAIELRGYVRDDELAGLYEAADLAFVASFAEGFSIPVAEAVVRGTPVVASDIGAHRELVGVGPWLAPGADVEALARALGHVRRDRDAVIEQQRKSLGDTADPPSVLERITAVLEPLLEERQEGQGRPLPHRARPHLAVVSPFPPQRSGVADYTAFTFRQIAQYADVEVYSPTPANSGPFRMHPLSSEPYLSKRLDAVVNVVGNSHFHFPILNLLSSYGGATIAHDNRMLEAYRYDRGEAWTAELLSRSGTHVGVAEIEEFLLDLDRLPSAGYDAIARQASPLIVHGSALAGRILRETGVSPVVVPFVPYNVPDPEEVDEAARARSREKLGFADDVIHFATFGIVDSRTKRTDLVIGALVWLRDWGRPAHLHIVGDTPKAERGSLEGLAAELGLASHVTMHGHVTAEALKDFLLAVDAAVQLRMSVLLSLSGALADCIAFGVPTMTTRDIADEMEAPPYVVTTGSATSSLLIAEALDGLCEYRREHAPIIEAERRDYLARRNVDAYARGLLAGLGLWSE